MEKSYLAFIRISAGSSWYQTDKQEDFELMAYKAVKQAKKDWKHLFKFKKDGHTIHMYFHHKTINDKRLLLTVKR